VEWFAFDVFKDQVVRTDVVDLTDVRMAEGGNDPGFLLEALFIVCLKTFDGYDAVEAGVGCLPDFSHSAGAEG
jgi:hypothetical protein